MIDFLTFKSSNGNRFMHKKAFLFAAIVVVLTAGFLYLDRNNTISHFIQSYGAKGVVAAILMMAVVCVTPLPSEGLLIMYLKIYGVALGTLYAWIGFMIGSVVVYEISRYVGNRFLHVLISPEQFAAVDKWVSGKGNLGLLFVRLLPIPALIVNCVIAMMPSVSIWNYIWTGGVTIVPYYTGVAFLFLGVFKQDLLAIAIGIPVLVVFWMVGYWVRRRGRG